MNQISRTLGLALGAAVSLSAANATLWDFTIEYSGASFGNTATGVGTVTIDDAFLLNPGDSSISGTPIVPGQAVVGVSLTITGASSGNGTFTTEDFDGGFFLRILDALTLDAEWMGQPQPHNGSLWGDPSTTTHDFNLFTTQDGVPDGEWFYTLRTDFQSQSEGPIGDQLLLVSFRPAEVNVDVPEASTMAGGIGLAGLAGWHLMRRRSPDRVQRIILK
jgi:hypothetical protein